MEKDYSKEDKYLAAKRRVDKIKGFYIHLAVYILVNTGITVLKVYSDIDEGKSLAESLWDFGTFAIWGFWGIGLAIHGLTVLGLPFLFGKNWEERKIKEFMEEENNQFKSFKK